eukprot:570434-Pleurochrysis_carterae.AAC.2
MVAAEGVHRRRGTGSSEVQGAARPRRSGLCVPPRAQSLVLRRRCQRAVRRAGLRPQKLLRAMLQPQKLRRSP